MHTHSATTGTKATDGFRRLEVITGVGRRRRWSTEEKARIVAESLGPATISSAVARRYGLHASQLFDSVEGESNRATHPVETRSLRSAACHWGTAMLNDKRARMLGDIPVARSVGVEIGALNSPLVHRSEGKVLYVDYATTDVVRANLRDPAIDPESVVEVDVVWGDRPLREAIGQQVDYVIASHVIEHVPDLIGWLLELHELLKPGGTLGLAVPDRRFTFDVRRNESVPSEMVEAYLLRYRRPSIRQVFDAASLSKNSEGPADRWADRRGGSLPPEVISRLPAALDLVQSLVSNSRYNDAHCWVFTPMSFLDSAEALVTMGLFPYVVAGFYPTEPDSIEFQARLTAVPPQQRDAIQGSITAARRTLETFEQEPVPPPLASEPGWPVDALLAVNADLDRQNAVLRGAIEALRQSTSWRLTAPLRAAVEYLRR